MNKIKLFRPQKMIKNKITKINTKSKIKMIIINLYKFIKMILLKVGIAVTK